MTESKVIHGKFPEKRPEDGNVFFSILASLVCYGFWRFVEFVICHLHWGW